MKTLFFFWLILFSTHTTLAQSPLPYAEMPDTLYDVWQMTSKQYINRSQTTLYPYPALFKDSVISLIIREGFTGYGYPIYGTKTERLKIKDAHYVFKDPTIALHYRYESPPIATQKAHDVWIKKYPHLTTVTTDSTCLNDLSIDTCLWQQIAIPATYHYTGGRRQWRMPKDTTLVFQPATYQTITKHYIKRIKRRGAYRQQYTHIPVEKQTITIKQLTRTPVLREEEDRDGEYTSATYPMIYQSIHPTNYHKHLKACEYEYKKFDYTVRKRTRFPIPCSEVPDTIAPKWKKHISQHRIWGDNQWQFIPAIFKDTLIAITIREGYKGYGHPIYKTVKKQFKIKDAYTILTDERMDTIQRIPQTCTTRKGHFIWIKKKPPFTSPKAAACKNERGIDTCLWQAQYIPPIYQEFSDATYAMPTDTTRISIPATYQTIKTKQIVKIKGKEKRKKYTIIPPDIQYIKVQRLIRDVSSIETEFSYETLCTHYYTKQFRCFPPNCIGD